MNLAALGLVCLPNKDIERANDTPQVADKGANPIELFDIPESDCLTKKQHPMKADDQQYIARCMTKYADDYPKMFRDIKLNNMQYTEVQLRKMGARFLLLSPEQRVVELPEKVKALQDRER